jgi:hypothetical protein
VKRIYLDTNIWDQLCDQKVDPKQFIDALASKGYTLVISFHTVYEFARTLTSPAPQAIARGRQLCAYAVQYLDLGIPCTKDFWEYVLAEISTCAARGPLVDPLTTADQCALIQKQLHRLASSDNMDDARQFIDQRSPFGLNTSQAQHAHIDKNPDLAAYLQTIAQPQLADWMSTESRTIFGANAFLHRFSKLITPVLTQEFVLALLGCPAAEMVRASVRTDLYSNWHEAHHGANRAGLYDDMLHVLQALYCDFYITEDKKQSAYAPLLLTPATHFESYRDRTTPIDQWILGLP